MTRIRFAYATVAVVFIVTAYGYATADTSTVFIGIPALIFALLNLAFSYEAHDLATERAQYAAPRPRTPWVPTKSYETTPAGVDPIAHHPMTCRCPGHR